MFLESYRSVLRAFQWCFKIVLKNVARKFQGAFKVFFLKKAKMGFRDILSIFQDCFRGVLRKLHLFFEFF